MARSRELRVQVVGDTSGLSRAFNKADADTRKWSTDGEKHSKRFSSALRDVGKAAVVSGAALGTAGLAFGIKKAVDEMRDAAKVGAQTTAVVKSTGGAANVSAKQISDLAEKLSLIAGADDEVIQRSQNLLLTFTKVRNEVGAGNKIFTQASTSIVDMAAAMAAGAGHKVGQADLKSATIQVGKALQDPIKGITALSRVGVTFTEQEKEKIAALVESGDQLKAQKIILAELRTEFKGSARANADSLDRLSVAFDNLFEKAGEALAPTIEKWSSWLVKFIRQMQNGKGAGGDFVDTLKDIGDTLADIWNVAKKVPPEVYALMGIAVAGVKINRAFGGLPGKAVGGIGGIAGKVASKAAPVPVFVTNPGFGGPGGGKGIPPILPTAGKTLATRVAIGAGRAIPVIGAAGVLYYIFSKNNRDLPTGAGEATRRSARGTPSGGRNVGDNLAPSPNATRRTEQLGDAFQRLAQRGRDLIPVVRKNADAARAFADRTDKMGSAARTSRSRLNDLKDSAKGFGGASDRAKDIAKRLRDRIESLGGSANRGETNVKKLRDEIDRLKSKTIKVNVGIDIAQAGGGFGGFGDGWGVEEAVGDHVEAGVKSGKINPFGFITGGMGGGGNLHGALPMMAPFAAAGARFGLAVSSGRDDHSKYTSSGNISNHWLGRALDISGSAQGMLAFARFLSQTFGSRLSELIHTPLGYSLKHGVRTSPIDAANHYSHVHVALQRGGLIPGHGDGDKTLVAAEPGEGFINKRAVAAMGGAKAINAINSLVPRFQGGGLVGPGGIPRTDWRMVKSIASKYGVDPLLLVAIGKIETDWGRLGDGRNGNVLGVGSYDTGSSYKWAGLRNQLRKGSELLKGWGATTIDAVLGGKASSWATDPGWESAVASKYREIATPHWVKNAKVAGDGDKPGGGGKPAGAKKPRPRLGAVSTYETDLAQADRLLDRAGDIDPTNKRDVQAVGGKLLLLGFRKAAIRRRLKKIRRDLRKKLSPATRRRLLDEQASLVGELGGIESESRGLHESMVPEAGEESTAAEDQAAAAKELAEQIKALKESIDEQNRITSSTAAIGLREAQRALADMISGEIGGLVGQRNRSPNDGMTAARY